jgi:hypothetical protein
VPGQTLEARQSHHLGPELPQLRGLELDEVGPLEEVLDADRRAEARLSAGGQQVVGARQVVADGDRRVVAEQDHAGVVDRLGGHLGPLYGEDQVLGRQLVHDGQGFIEILGDDRRASGRQRVPGGSRLAELLELLGELVLDARHDALVVGDQHRAGARIVLDL